MSTLWNSATAALNTLVWSHDGGALGEVLPVATPPVHADSVLLLQGQSVLQRPLGVVLNIDIVHSAVQSTQRGPKNLDSAFIFILNNGGAAEH